MPRGQECGRIGGRIAELFEQEAFGHGLEPIAHRDGMAELAGWPARPITTPRAAVVVFPTIINRNAPIERRARMLAKEGYLAMIADFYGASFDSFDVQRAASIQLRADTGSYRRRLMVAVDALAGIEEAAGLPLLGLGHCMGGGAILELARAGADIQAVVSFHGLLETSLPAPPGGVRSRILVCHDDADPLVAREQVLAFWQEMDAAEAGWHFHSYSKVKHAFTYESEGQASAVAGYDASADRQSWAAMLSFFGETHTERRS